MKRSLRTQMLFQYAGIVLVCMIVIPAVIFKTLDTQLKKFTETRTAEDEQEIVLILQDIYESGAGGAWNIARLSQVYGDLSRRPIVSATLFDNYGRVIWQFKRSDMWLKRHDRMVGPDGRARRRWINDIDDNKNIVRERVISVDENPVGKIRFVYLPFIESHEGVFLKQFNSRMLHAVGFMLIIASLVAFVMAERISKPILNVVKRASLISKGKYRSTEQMCSRIKELQALIESIDKLGLSLEEQEELRKRLIGDVAHELRNPITIVKSHLEAFEDGVWSPTPERIKLTVGEIDRLSLLIAEIERLSSLESGDEHLDFSCVDLSEELERTAMSLEPLYKDKSLTLLREIQPKVVTAVDIAKLRRAVENLLQNAMRYTDSGGEVRLSLKQKNAVAEISVQDSGIGVCEKDLPFIFERFYRTDKSRTRESGGMGIGLAIAKVIVEAHGGEITVCSREGSGSKFTITLPVRRLSDDEDRLA